MAGDFNFNIEKLPDSAIFLIPIGIALLIWLFVSGHTAVAFTAIFIICTIVCVASNKQSTPALCAAAPFFLLLAIAIGAVAVSSEWVT